MVRIAGFHPADPGSIPGVGNAFQLVRARVLWARVNGGHRLVTLSNSDGKVPVRYSPQGYPSLGNGARLKIEC